jgi:CRISPR/Cas system-associated exonuclease Cas4 (RecB family)
LYESCPQKYRLKYIDKEPEPPKAADNAADRGNRVHTDLEGYLKGTNDLPEEATKLQDVYDKLLNKKLTIEEDWGFNKDWQPTGWFDDDISCRIKYLPISNKFNCAYCPYGDKGTAVCNYRTES